MIRRLSVLALVVVAVAAPTTAVAATASLPDIEDEVMCPVCGTLLELSDSPQAERERAYINRLIAEGRTKEEIKDALVSEYGPNVLATPSDHGFDLTAWIVPVIALVALAAALGLAWWRRGRPAPGRRGRDPGSLSQEDASRLERDMSSYEL